MTLRQLPSGLYVPRGGLGAAPGRLPVPPDAGTSPNPADAAKGYLPPSAASAAQKAFAGLAGGPQWVPTDETQVKAWAKQQAQVFGSKAVQQGISDGGALYAAGKSPAPEIRPPFSENETVRWAEQYVGGHGFPHDDRTALAMVHAYVADNATAIGIPPEFIAAARIVEHLPNTPEEAAKWAVTLGTEYLSMYGIPIVDSFDTSAFISASARAAATAIVPGVPFGFFEATFDALADGTLTEDEARGIIVGAAGYVGAAIGQAFGIPAPIGAVIGQLLAGAIMDGLSSAFGWGQTDAEQLLSAQQSAQAAAAAATSECTSVATALWLEYQHYWDGIVRDLNQTIHSNQEWILTNGACGPTSGLRFFGDTTLDVVYDPSGNPTSRHYPYPVTRSCGSNAGCPYLSVPLDSIVVRDRYPLSLSDLRSIGAIDRKGPGCDAMSALAVWNARRYATPMQVLYAMQGKPLQWVVPSGGSGSELTSAGGPQWENVMHADSEYLSKVIGLVSTVGPTGTEVGTCNVKNWATMMFKSLEQAAAAAALVQRDIARTVSAANVAYGVQYHLSQAAGLDIQAATDAQKRAAVRQVSANAASVRHQIKEAVRRGRKKADLLNYGLLVAGGSALLGFGVARSMR